MISLSELWTTDAVWQVPDGWQQGRGAWGGLVSGQVLTSAMSQLPRSSLRPRSLHIAMLGPVPVGEVTVAVRELRAGRATFSQEVTLTSAEGELLTHATVISGEARRETAVSNRIADLPPVPTRGDTKPTRIGPPLAPGFTGNLVFTPVVGWPYSGAAELVVAGWISLGNDATDELTPPIIAALADGWWTAALVGMGLPTADGGPVPIATLDFMLTFPAEPPPASEGLWRTGLWHEGRVVGGREGYLTEERVLRAPTGEVLAWNTQLVAVGRTT